MKNGKCLLYDVTEFYFLLYKYINDSWVRFVIVEGNDVRVSYEAKVSKVTWIISKNR